MINKLKEPSTWLFLFMIITYYILMPQIFYIFGMISFITIILHFILITYEFIKDNTFKFKRNKKKQFKSNSVIRLHMANNLKLRN